MRAAVVVVLVGGLAIGACGAKPPPPAWIEEDFQPHAVSPTTPGEPVPGTAAEPAPDSAGAAGVPGTGVPGTGAPGQGAGEPVPDTGVRGRIAVLLPLSGRFAAIGAELRAAVELAAVAGIDWRFLDTAGAEATAAAAVDRAADDGAVAILGPVGRLESAAATGQAIARGIPIALLGPDDGADPAAGVFRVVTSPADEARAAARLAAEQAFPTVAVLAPRDDVGAAMAAAFADAARAAGLTVTAEGSYDPLARSLEPEVKAFLGLVPAENPRLRAHLARHGRAGWQTFSPDVAFSLLYVPDQHQRAALIAAYLPYLGVELRSREIVDPLLLRRKHRGRIPQVVQLVGSSGWNHPGLVPRGGPAVDGALIVAVHAGALDPGSDLAARYQARTGRALTAAAAQAHDAALLVAAAAQGPGGAPRAAMRAALARARIGPEVGHCGPALMGPDGEVERAPVILEVDGAEIVLAP